jgi:hypothetical protein
MLTYRFSFRAGERHTARITVMPANDATRTVLCRSSERSLLITNHREASEIIGITNRPIPRAPRGKTERSERVPLRVSGLRSDAVTVACLGRKFSETGLDPASLNRCSHLVG